MIQTRSSAFVLCFRSLLIGGRSYSFPCDGSGRVDLDQLSEHARNDYFYARAMIGRELKTPAVQACETAMPSLDGRAGGSGLTKAAR